MKDHTVVVGFGTKGRSAVSTLLGQGVPSTSIVVVDASAEAIADANQRGVAGVTGDATRSEVLARAEVGRAKRVIVAAQRDDTAVLVTLTARALNKKAVIVSSVREAENAPLLQQSGANTVITSSAAAGRLLGVASTNPSLGEVLEDLLIPGSGLQLTERVLRTGEVGASVKDLPEIVLAIVRNGKVRLYDDPDCSRLRQDDHVVVLEAVGPRREAADEG